MKNEQMQSTRQLAREEVAIFAELCRMDDEDTVLMYLQLVEIDPENRLKILLNRRHKFEKGEECSEFENSIHEITGSAARAYAAEIYTNFYYEGKALPFPEVEPENDGEDNFEPDK